MEDEQFSYAEAVWVLSMGQEVPDNVLHDALRSEPNARCYSARDCRDLSMIPDQTVIEFAVLHQTLGPFELAQASATIRHRWPHARILVIRLGEDFLDDALYDDRIVPPVSPTRLLGMIKRILSQRHDSPFPENEQKGSE